MGDKRWRGMRWAASFCLAFGVAGCQTGMGAGAATTFAPVDSLTIPVHHAWGGEVRCDSGECRLAVVEHEGNAVALYRLDGSRKSQLLSKAEVAYHPDSVKWLNDRLVAATVEATQSIDVFDTQDGKLQLLQQVVVGFAPRDLHVLGMVDGAFSLVVSPYSGDDLLWLKISEDGRSSPSQVLEPWCRSPRHPVLLPHGLQGAGAGVAVGCDRDFRVLFRPLGLGTPPQKPAPMERFNNVPRQVIPSPSGRWLYVVQEQGGRNARIDTRTGRLQWIKAPRWGAVSVAPISDDLVIWGDDEKVHLQQLDADGRVEAMRWLPTTGFPTQLQLIDADQDGALDLVVYNSAGTGVDVLYGPLWEKAKPSLTNEK